MRRGQPAALPLGLASAEFSDCGTYRYQLRRVWDASLPTVVFVMLNPSTADATTDDPTIRRCVGFARGWGGLGALEVVNAYALRATDPRQLAGHPDPVGPDNHRWLDQAADTAHLMVCAWGANITPAREAELVASLRARRTWLHVLGLTAAGRPKHPLYLPGNLFPQVWT